MSQVSVSATSVSGISGERYRLEAKGVGCRVVVTDGSGAIEGKGEGVLSGVFGTHETLRIASTRETPLRARFPIKNFVMCMGTG